MAVNAQDYTKLMKGMLGVFPVDMTAMQDVFKTQATLGEKMSKVAVDAAENSAEVSAKWTRQTLAKVAEVTKVKDDPADYTKAMTDFASAQAEIAAESMSAFAEIAKKVQMETVELVLAAGKDVSEDATAAESHCGNDRGGQESDSGGQVSQRIDFPCAGFPPAGAPDSGKLDACPFFFVPQNRRVPVRRWTGGSLWPPNRNRC